jgi:hypothetical protein
LHDHFCLGATLSYDPANRLRPMSMRDNGNAKQVRDDIVPLTVGEKETHFQP